MQLVLGSRREGDDETVALPAAALLRHLFAVGSSGSGKTVLCKAVIEEAARRGIPAICVDPQGDLASFALAEGELGERIDPVIFTPASAAGVAVCADPLGGEAGEDLERWAARASRLLVSALGYDLGADDGDGLAVAFAELLAAHRRRGGAAALASFLGGVDAEVEGRREALEAVVARRTLTAALRRLRRLETPGRRGLFVDGLPLAIDALLEPAGAGGRARVAVLYLNSLDSQEDKELVVATLVDRLYRWMLARPSPELQLLFYIDEVAPYLPPVRKPACKEGLVLLLKQARKYGVGCLIASQNPGDVDYRALGQLGTWALGRLVTRQDLDKIAPPVSSLAGPRAGDVLAALPRLEPGQFFLVSPDVHDEPVALAGRRLDSPHRTLDLEAVAALADERWRGRFGVVKPDAEPEPEPEPEAEPEPDAESDAEAEPEAEPEPASPSSSLDAAIAEALAGTDGLRGDHLAARIGRSESHTRRRLRDLVAAGRVAKLRRGREVHYLWIEGGGRVDLELGAEVTCARRDLRPERARGIAEGYVRGRLFGLLGDRERLASLEAVERPLYAVDYREAMRPGAIERLLGHRDSHLEGTVYFEPATLELLQYSKGSGIRFAEPDSRSPTQIEDLDGHAVFLPAPLAELCLDEARWRRRRPAAEVLSRFRALFAAEPTGVRTVLLPLWRVGYQQSGGGATRVLHLDALRGHPVEWPGP